MRNKTGLVTTGQKPKQHSFVAVPATKIETVWDACHAIGRSFGTIWAASKGGVEPLDKNSPEEIHDAILAFYEGENAPENEGVAWNRKDGYFEYSSNSSTFLIHLATDGIEIVQTFSSALWGDVTIETVWVTEGGRCASFSLKWMGLPVEPGVLPVDLLAAMSYSGTSWYVPDLQNTTATAMPPLWHLLEQARKDVSLSDLSFSSNSYWDGNTFQRSVRAALGNYYDRYDRQSVGVEQDAEVLHFCNKCAELSVSKTLSNLRETLLRGETTAFKDMSKLARYTALHSK